MPGVLADPAWPEAHSGSQPGAGGECLRAPTPTPKSEDVPHDHRLQPALEDIDPEYVANLEVVPEVVAAAHLDGGRS